MLATLETLARHTQCKSASGAGKFLCVRGGHVTVTNGWLFMGAYVPELKSLTFAVEKTRFVSAVKAAGKNVQITVTGTGRVSVRGGGFRALIATMPVDQFPVVDHQDVSYPCEPGIIESIKRVIDFAATTAPKPWACSVLLSDNAAYATNNTVLCSAVVRWGFKSAAIPVDTAKVLCALKRDITTVTVTDSAVEFSFTDLWVKTPLIAEPWPNVGKLIKRSETACDIPDEFKQNLKTLLPFCKDKNGFIKLGGSKAAVKTESGDAEISAPDFVKGSFNGALLHDVVSIADKMSFIEYPQPCYFKGSGIEGMLVGLSQ